MNINNSLNSVSFEGASGFEEVERAWEEIGEDRSILEINGWEQTHLFAKYGKVSALRVLASQEGVDLNAQDLLGRTSLHLAVENSHRDAVAFLLEKGANVNAQTIRGESTAHLAKTGRVVKILCERGVDLELADDRGFFPIHRAALNGRVAVVLTILEARGKSYLDQSDSLGRKPLHFAALRGHEMLLMQLMRFGARVHCVDSQGRTPLHLAAATGRVKMIKRLFLDYRAFLNSSDMHGCTAVHLAAANGQIKAIEALASLGACVSLLDVFDQSLVDYALLSDAGEEFVETVRGLVESDLRLQKRLKCGGA